MMDRLLRFGMNLTVKSIEEESGTLRSSDYLHDDSKNSSELLDTITMDNILQCNFRDKSTSCHTRPPPHSKVTNFGHEDASFDDIPLNELLEAFLHTSNDEFMNCFVSSCSLFISTLTFIDYISMHFEKTNLIEKKLSLWILQYLKFILSDDRLQDKLNKLLFVLEKTGMITTSSAQTLRMIAQGLPMITSKSRVIFFAPEIQNLQNCYFSFWEMNECDIARQICLQDEFILTQILPQELFVMRASTSVIAITERYNRLCIWASSSVYLQDTLDWKAFEKLLLIAQYLKKFKNYSSFFSLMQGLAKSLNGQTPNSHDHNPAVTQMLNLFRELSLTEFNMSASRNLDSPCIPFYTPYWMLLNELQDGEPFVEEKGDDETTLVHWQKIKKIHVVIREIEKYQTQIKKTPYPFRANVVIQNLIEHTIRS
ncbi:hypothetical protein FDP41_003888 [Naegleria fowleri]|uniref:Ras-GEF domain-containing protein n=1 Tax=Naegleria fowleri TaxID=5763 RepID=A0A6A5BV70_NAEFO|nr:uncharacterized protein FDP41_003888 [Naegleria fowleri]KAF0977235.1 hypothetical protein FDP41_003888 [Naegleria fowleri]